MGSIAFDFSLALDGPWPSIAWLKSGCALAGCDAPGVTARHWCSMQTVA